MSDTTDGSSDTSLVARILDAIGFVFTILWIGVLIYGLNQNWLRQLPLGVLVMLLVGFVLAKHFVMHQVGHMVSQVLHTLLSGSRTSNWMCLLTVGTCAFIGGSAGWILTQKYTSEVVAAGSAAFGAVLLSLMAIAIIRQGRHSKLDQSKPDACGSYEG